jgi:hypothetical protein
LWLFKALQAGKFPSSLAGAPLSRGSRDLGAGRPAVVGSSAGVRAEPAVSKCMFMGRELRTKRDEKHSNACFLQKEKNTMILNKTSRGYLPCPGYPQDDFKAV